MTMPDFTIFHAIWIVLGLIVLGYFTLTDRSMHGPANLGGTVATIAFIASCIPLLIFIGVALLG